MEHANHNQCQCRRCRGADIHQAPSEAEQRAIISGVGQVFDAHGVSSLMEAVMLLGMAIGAAKVVGFSEAEFIERVSRNWGHTGRTH